MEHIEVSNVDLESQVVTESARDPCRLQPRPISTRVSDELIRYLAGLIASILAVSLYLASCKAQPRCYCGVRSTL